MQNHRNRRHHYVWQKYLEPWTSDNLVYCMIKDNGKIIHANPVNLAVEKDFYKIKNLSDEDIKFISQLFIDNQNERIKKVNREWQELYTLIYQVKSLFVDLQNNSRKIQEAIERTISNFYEEHLSRIENIGVKYLNKLYNLETSFFQDDEEYAEFIYYLCTQYFRTRKRKDAVKRATKNFKGVNIDNMWDLIALLIVTNVGTEFYKRREFTTLRLLLNQNKYEFITSDQPIINTFAVNLPESQVPENIEFYYPLKPHLAICITPKDGDRNVVIEEVTATTVEKFNDNMVKMAGNQLFAKSDFSLIRLTPNLNANKYNAT